MGNKATVSPASSFYFPTGNLVLIADSTAFKVHGALLAQNSELFNDVLASPRPDDQEIFDSCPCIELEESESDFKFFLSVLYDDLFFHYRKATDFPAIEAVLRLSSKYRSPKLRQSALNRLLLDWPTTLAGWDTREKLATDEQGRYIPREFFPAPNLIVHLAQQNNIPEILPAALYDACRYRPERTPDLPVIIPEAYHIKALASVLPQSLKGRGQAISHMPKFIHEHVRHRKAAPGCIYRYDADPSRLCLDSFYLLSHFLRRSITGTGGGRDADPLFTLDLAVETLAMPSLGLDEKDEDGKEIMYVLNICEACRRDFDEVCKKEREAIWETLGMWFGLKR
ncbi:hypothetical protein C8J56DRAFT_828781 [Mycena floridula]|nr:hypothetical protein C8J56DRAFT_828781 [Mycena floridula]